MNSEPIDPSLSWDRLREAWHRSPPETSQRAESNQRLRRLWAAEARRMRWIALGDWCLALAMAGILSTVALRLTDPAGRCLLVLATLGCLAHPSWSLRRRRALWRATADSPRAYWTLRVERARQSLRFSQVGFWWFGSGLLLGACIRWILPMGSLPLLERWSATRPWMAWVVLGLVLSGFLTLQVWRHRRLGGELETCRSTLEPLGLPGDEDSHAGKTAGMPPGKIHEDTGR
ncbi:MAG: DUF2339 domain-containing protein [Verrucomicrobia bacterium]|nr:DUF2339 domain-containing protein [Verrucomicrobiota bacterium]